MDETREIDIDLRKIFYMMRSKVIYIILATIFLAVTSGLFTHFFITPVYTAHIKVGVSVSPDNVTTDSTASINDINAAKLLTSNYVETLRSDSVLDEVARVYNENSKDAQLEGSQINSMLSTRTVEDTSIFFVYISYKDPQKATNIANTIAKVAPQAIADISKQGGMFVIDTAKVPSAPTSPNLKKNIMIGAVIGFALSFAAFFIYEMFDTSITNVKDLEREFEFPVLGTVPMLESVDNNKKKDKSNKNPDDFMGLVPDPVPKPSSALLENIQSMKGDAKNDQA